MPKTLDVMEVSGGMEETRPLVAVEPDQEATILRARDRSAAECLGVGQVSTVEDNAQAFCGNSECHSYPCNF